MIDLSLLKKPVFVKEHGTWAMLIVPAVTGIAQAPQVSVSLVPFLLAVFFLFFAYTPAEILFSEIKNQKKNSLKYRSSLLWFFIYTVIGLSAGAVSVMYYQKYTLLLFGLAAGLCFTFGLIADRNFKAPLVRDISAIIGLAIISPAVFYYLNGTSLHSMLLLWFYNALYFVSSALYIHTKMLQPSKDTQGDRSKKYYRLRNANSTYQLILLLLVLSLSAYNKMSVMGALAFTPMIAHCLIGAFVIRQKVHFKYLGYVFAVYALHFAAFFRI